MNKNILEDSKDSLSQRKTHSLLPRIKHSSSNREAFRRQSKDIGFLFRKVCNASKIFLALPFMQTDKYSFSSSWSCLPSTSWSPRTAGYRVRVCLLLYTHYQQSKEEKNTYRWRWSSYQWCRKYLNSTHCTTWFRSEVWTCISQP